MTVDSLEDPRLAIVSPFHLEVHRAAGGVTLHDSDSDVFGFGEDEAAALHDFRAAVAELFFTLDGDRASLGPALQATLRSLEAKIRKTL